jgi:hypothetical protein
MHAKFDVAACRWDSGCYTAALSSGEEGFGGILRCGILILLLSYKPRGYDSQSVPGFVMLKKTCCRSQRKFAKYDSTKSEWIKSEPRTETLCD